ncbi:DUF3325 domain-containing protein [Rheinheimera mangrovi]|uniref:DUF3325 domain-containing protein n=1 Tax=Rheinheimera mangrovi TaxID=2498451 RepID=UPI000F8C860D|nr:DUF3325 domain-containing protein [Rheinheimera mangrovi]
MDLLLLFGVLASGYAAMAALGLSMDKHFEQVFGTEPKAFELRVLQSAGWLYLLLALWLCIQGWQLAIGFVVWFGTLTLMQGSFALLLAYQQRLTSVLLWAAVPLATLSAVLLWSSKG